MSVYEIIEKKRNKKKLSESEIEFFIQGVMDKSIKNYEASAFLMAICINGMNTEEAFYLTKAMVNSGDVINFNNDNYKIVDKHSTGGIGDTTSIIVAPIVASLGAKMAKMSGESLGYTGGTIDKLRVFTGYRTDITKDEFLHNVKDIGASIISQTDNLAPADRILYKLRGDTASVDSVALIAASIMSKKISSGSDVIVLDVKYGDGSLVKTLVKAQELASMMVHIGKKFEKKVIAIISNMENLLSDSIGCTEEVIDAISVLKGKTGNLAKLSKTISEKILVEGGYFDSKTAKKMVKDSIDSGNALLKLQEIIKAHGGDDTLIARNGLITKSKFKYIYKSANEGYISKIDIKKLGLIINRMSKSKDNPSNCGKSVGIRFSKKINSKVHLGDKILEVLYNSKKDFELYKSEIEKSILISKSKSKKTKLIHSIIR